MINYQTMKAYEFNTKTSSDGKIDFPEDIQKKLPPSQKVRVIILINDDLESEDKDKQNWSRLAAEQFFADYSEEDEIYNQI